MKPDDWLKAIHNEAERAPDSQWAQEARLSAERSALFRGFGFSAALYGLLAILHLALLATLRSTADGFWLWTSVMGAAALVGLILGGLRVSFWAVSAGAALYLPAVWLGVVVLQALWPTFAPLSPEIPDVAVLILPVLALNSATFILMLRR